MTNIKLSKLIINSGIVLSLFVGVYILFFREPVNNKDIHLLFYLVLLIYQARYFYLINFVKKQRVTFQVMEKRKRPILSDTVAGLLFFCVVPIFWIFIHKKFNAYLDWTDGIAAVIYILGTLITLVSESQRRKWKIQYPNTLFKSGLFKYANHINYFGETLSFPAFCWVATGSIIVFVAVVVYQIIDFALIQIPKQEKYLKNKYSKDFSEIANRKKLIPFVY